MKYTVVKTIVVTTKELYEIEIAGHLNPLDYVGPKTPASVVTERSIKVDIFRKEKGAK